MKYINIYTTINTTIFKIKSAQNIANEMCLSSLASSLKSNPQQDLTSSDFRFLYSILLYCIHIELKMKYCYIYIYTAVIQYRENKHNI